MSKLYRLYIDESGDHTYKNLKDPAKRYLSLTGLMIESQEYRTNFQPSLERLKQKHFPHDPDNPLILHRNDIINKRSLFRSLLDHQREKDFNQALLDFLSSENYKLITVVIDKKTHEDRYGSAAFHPYHYCLAAMLERYCGYMHLIGAKGDVMAESRGGSEDRQLKAAYQELYNQGTLHRASSFFQQVLTTKEIKLKPKQANIAGLQIADLLAHPLKQDILVEERRILDWEDTFGQKICETVTDKYNRQVYKNIVHGYGKVFLK